MTRAVPLALLASLLSIPAWATWSVIAVDQKSGQVAIASASCVDDTDDGMRDAIAVVVPGKAVAACQAAVDRTHQNHALIMDQLRRGTPPEEIMKMLSADPAFQSRQFGILDMQGRVATHTGLNNTLEAVAFPGQVPGTGIYFVVLGNTIRHGALRKGARAFVDA